MISFSREQFRRIESLLFQRDCRSLCQEHSNRRFDDRGFPEEPSKQWIENKILEAGKFGVHGRSSVRIYLELCSKLGAEFPWGDEFKWALIDLEDDTKDVSERLRIIENKLLFRNVAQ